MAFMKRPLPGGDRLVAVAYALASMVIIATIKKIKNRKK